MQPHEILQLAYSRRPLRASDARRIEAPVPALLEPDLLMRGRVEFLPNWRFEPSNREGSTMMFLLPARDQFGDVVDLIAFGWHTPRPWSLLGRAAVMGGEEIHIPRFDELVVHKDVPTWLRASRRGVVIVDPIKAAELLAGVRLAAADLKHSAELRRVLLRCAPSISVRISA